MQKEYWLDRWERKDIGFHQNEINPYLCQFWQSLQLAPGSTVLVPLCGKSRDMLWLHQQGHTVLGVELSIVAAQAFFAENGLIPILLRNSINNPIPSGNAAHSFLA